jgi:hypothetical protein
MSHPDDGTIQMLLDGELGADDRARIEAHARSCAACAARIDEARAFQQEADRLVDLVAVPVVAEGERPRARPRGAGMRTLAWAASIVLAVGLGYYARGGMPTRPEETPEVVRPAQPTTPMDGQAVTAQQVPVPASPAPAPMQAERQAEAHTGAATPAGDARQRGGVESKQSTAVAPPSPAVGVAALERENRPSRDAAAVAPPTAPAANAQPAKTTAELRADAAAGSHDEPAVGWRVIALEEAVRILGGQVRLIDGLAPDRVETGPGTAVAGADPTSAVVRVVYGAGSIVLDEQREGKLESDGRLSAARAAPRAAAAPPAGWREAGAIRYAVTGSVSPDSLRALADRVR